MVFVGLRFKVPFLVFFFFFLIFQSTANSLNCSFSTDFTFFWFYTWVSVFNINKTFTVFIAIKFCVVNFIVHYREFPNLFHPSRFRVFCYFPVIKFIGIFGWISGYHRLLSQFFLVASLINNPCKLYSLALCPKLVHLSWTLSHFKMTNLSFATNHHVILQKL